MTKIFLIERRCLKLKYRIGIAIRNRYVFISTADLISEKNLEVTTITCIQ